MHDWVAKRIETIDKYQPDMLWFDMGTDHPHGPAEDRGGGVLLQPRAAVGQAGGHQREGRGVGLRA